MLDLSRLREQFEGFNTYQAREEDLHAWKLQRALTALENCGSDWERINDAARAASVSWLRAELREAPQRTSACGPRPTPITVVATDGSQIYPDRHVEPTCYLLNVSRIAFQYGTLERPLMESVPFFRYRNSDLESYIGQLGMESGIDGMFERATTDIVSALRDQLELESLLDAAQETRMPDRPIVAVADGTLIRWMLGALPNPQLKQLLIGLYVQKLSEFRQDHIPLCSYISMPGSTEVVNLLRVMLNEHDEGRADNEGSLAGLLDRHVFDAVLGPGERSVVFVAASHIQKEYAPEDRICYFYVRIPAEIGEGEIGRVEIPYWIAESPDVLDMIHALILSECAKGFGYPMILAEAHERAVIRAREKELFYHMIETEMRTAGLRYSGSRKQASKQRPVV